MSMAFDANAAAEEDSGIFGVSVSPERAAVVLIPVPWDATTTYGGGAARGPQAILAASRQVDLYDFHFGEFYSAGIAMLEESADIREWNFRGQKKNVEEVNYLSQQINTLVGEQTKAYLAQGKIVGVVGGDHSTPLGAIAALSERYREMSVLQIDAHADLRKAYGGYTYSHASIMYNVLQETGIKHLVQVGVRDFCGEELTRIRENPGRITTFFDGDLLRHKMQGTPFATVCEGILAKLGEYVYLSCDIDGLDPRFCPHTGTPVPGGLEFNELVYLLHQLTQRGHRLVGFDLCEVAPGPESTAEEGQIDAASEWDANVGARVLFKLCGAALELFR